MKKNKLLGKINKEKEVAMCSLCGGGTDCSCGSCGICNCGSCYNHPTDKNIWY